MRQLVVDNIGKEIGGRYRILARLGEGGMGTVYRAEQMSLKRRVAVKVLKAELSEDEALVRRFNAEAELAAKLNHPNTVTLYDFGQDDDGSLFIAMEYVEGESLREIMVREGPMPVPRALYICAQVCASIADAHSHGIVHRDLKPDNVMLTERGKKTDVVRVLDFGIAKLRDEKGDVTAMPMTQAGDLLGTPQYMAPEQIRGEKVDGRTDVYAMGAMVYELVTGRLPFEAPTLMAILSKHLTEMPVPPTDRRADLAIPPALSALVMNALAKQRDERPASMDSFGDKLRDIAATITGQVATAPASAPVQQPGPAAASPAMLSVVSAPPGVPRRLATPVPHLTGPREPGHAPRAPIEESLAHAADSVARAGALLQPQPGAPAGPAPQPMITPAGMTHQVPQTREHAPGGGKGWLWAIVAVLVLGGGGGAAFYALGKSDKKNNETVNDEDDKGEKRDDDKGDPPSKEGDVPSLHDWDLSNNSGVDVNHGDPTAAADEAWRHPEHSVVIRHPAGFSHRVEDDMHMLSGHDSGHDIILYVYATKLDRRATATMQSTAVKQLIKSADAKLLKGGRQKIAGKRRYSAVYQTDDGKERGQAVVFTKGKLFVLIGFATRPEHFSHTNQQRLQFFEDRVAVL